MRWIWLNFCTEELFKIGVELGIKKNRLRFKEEADEKSGWGGGNLIFQVIKIDRTFKNGSILKFESIKINKSSNY